MTVVKRPRRSKPIARKKQPPIRVRTPKREKSPSSGIWRLVVVWCVLAAGILGLGWRLYQLQMVQAKDLQKRARQQQTTSIRPYIPRRAIVDGDRNVLATDRLIYTLYVHPKLFGKPPEAVAEELAPLLNRPKAELVAQFKQKESGIRLAVA
jgi:cell division protein FtsI (penicillin-binding protein 3)